MNELPFIGKGERVKGILDLIHMDVYGPMPIHSRGGLICFITFINDYS